MLKKEKIGLKILLILIGITLFWLGLEKASYATIISTGDNLMIGNTLRDSDTGLVYQILENQKLAIRGCEKDNLNLNIEEMVSVEIRNESAQTSGAISYEVIEIGSGAFAGKTIENISIPSSITTIYPSAFADSQINNISILAKNLTIQQDAFNHANIEGKLLISGNIVEIRYQAFLNVTKIGVLSIDANEVNIRQNAFDGCNRIEGLEIKNSSGKTVIEPQAFPRVKLNSVIINGGLNDNIKEYAFAESRIQNLELQKTMIMARTFGNCGIENVLVSNTAIIERDGFAGATIQRLNFSGNTREILPYSFSNCTIQELRITPNIQTINQAFMGTTINYLYIEDGVPVVREIWFAGSHIGTLRIRGMVSFIERGAFRNTNLENLILEGTEINRIEEGAFAENAALSNITFSGNVKINYLGKQVFNNTAIRELVIPNETIDIIGAEAFANNEILEVVTIGEGVQEISARAFEGTSIGKVTIPRTVNIIGDYAFANNRNLEEVILEEGVQQIGNDVFKNDPMLKKIVINSSISRIGSFVLPNEDVKIYCQSNTYVSNYLQEAIPSNNIVLDDDGPVAHFSPDGTTSPIDVEKIEITIEVTDVVGIKEDSLKVVFTTSEQAPVESQFVNSFQSGDSIICTLPSQSANVYAWVLAEDLLGNRHITRSQVYQIDKSGPSISFSPNGNEKVQKTQSTMVNVTDDMSGINPNLKYVWLQEGTTIPSEEQFTNYFTNGNSIEKANGDGNWYLWVLAKDGLGHKTIQRSNVFLLDNTMPTIQVQYTTQSPTNKPVTATITANEKLKQVEGWLLSEDGRTLIKEYTENVQEQVRVSDLAGNEQMITVAISNIVKNGPKVTFSPNGNIEPQKGAEVKVDVTKNIADINENTLKYVWVKGETRPEVSSFTNTLINGQKIVKEGENGNWYLWILAYDVLGNETIQKSEMFKLDNTSPIVEVEYNNTNLTNRNVTVIIRANEELQALEGWNLSEDRRTLTKEYENNLVGSIRIKDLAGNETITHIQIGNIDKIAPTTNVSYSETEVTNKNVIATITSNEAMQEIQGWTLSNDKKVLTKEYTQNTKEIVLASDIAGNQVSIEVSISNIDKEGPRLQVEYKAKENKIIQVFIKSDEEIQEVSNWILSDDKTMLTREYTENTKETISIKDKIGNITTIEINVTDIDTIPPIVQVEYSIKEETNNPVVVTLKSNERLQQVEGWILAEDQMTLTKTYEKNAIEKVIIKDLSGNEVEVQIQVENIRNVQIGDINKDGTIDITDLFQLKRHIIAGSKTNWLLTTEKRQYADMNQDGTIDITDLFLMKRAILKRI